MLPDSLLTPIARTQSGGWHYYFKHPGHTIGNNARKLEEIDFRGDGGYIVAPPTNGGKGSYTWVDGLSIFDAALEL